MVFFLKTFITYSIILSSFLTIIHTDEHDHEKQEEYSICNTDCNEKGHHLKNHQCELCIDNNSSIFLPNASSKISYKYYSYLTREFEYEKKSHLHSNLLSRPPPILL